MQDGTKTALVAIATYNERDNLASLVGEILTAVPTVHVLVIDDASPDGTGQLADELAAKDDRVKVMHRQGKLGLGTAIIAGMKYSIENDYEKHVTMDADYSHHPKYLPALIDMPATADIQIGSRYIPGGGIENWPWTRLLISKSVNVLTRLLLRVKARDASGGFRCYRTTLLQKIPFGDLWSLGYSFQEEMLFRCMKAGAVVTETPIVFVNREKGKSKANMKEMIRSLWILIKLGMTNLFRPSRFKV